MEYHEIGVPFRYTGINIIAERRMGMSCQGCTFFVGRICLLKDKCAWPIISQPLDPLTMCEALVRPDKENIIYLQLLGSKIKD